MLSDLANWRRSPITGYVEIRLPNGEWSNPECAELCSHCGVCLGCLKGWYDTPGDRFHCHSSPDGNHRIEVDHAE